MRFAMSVCVYYSLDHLFSRHGGVCWEKWELQCLCVYIIPLVTYFPKHRGLLTELRIAMSVSVYYSFDHLFPQHEGGCWAKWELQCLCVYITPLITYFPNMEGVAHRNENCNACMCILFPRSRISPNMEGVAHRNENCNVCICIKFPW